jgi:ankyrin repeat protein
VFGQTTLSSAASKRQESIVRLLNDTDKVYIDSRDEGGQTPLSWAARKGHEVVARLLMDTTKVDVESMDNNGNTPCRWAEERLKTEIALAGIRVF